MRDFELDFQNLDEALAQAKRRREKFKDFQTLFFGVLVGALVSTPLQLMLKPLTFTDGTVRYGSAELMTNLHPFQYFIIAMMVVFLLLFALLAGYRLYTRLDFDPTVHARIPDTANNAFGEIKDHLRDQADEIGLEVNESDKVLVCYDPTNSSRGLKPESDEEILTVAHRDDLGIISIEFNQRDWRYKPLVSSLKQEYESAN